MPSQVVNACDNLPKILRSPESWLKVDEGEVFLGLSLSWPCHVQSDKGGPRFDHRLRIRRQRTAFFPFTCDISIRQ
jgi:hypothetical protein